MCLPCETLLVSRSPVDVSRPWVYHSGKSHTYTRVYQKKLRNNYVVTAIANYTVYAKNAGNYILVKCTLNDAVTVTYGSKSNFSAWPGIECQTAITTIDVQATKGKTYTFNVGKTKYTEEVSRTIVQKDADILFPNTVSKITFASHT